MYTKGNDPFMSISLIENPSYQLHAYHLGLIAQILYLFCILHRMIEYAPAVRFPVKYSGLRFASLAPLSSGVLGFRYRPNGLAMGSGILLDL